MAQLLVHQFPFFPFVFSLRVDYTDQLCIKNFFFNLLNFYVTLNIHNTQRIKKQLNNFSYILSTCPHIPLFSLTIL